MNARADGRPQIRFRQYPYGVTYNRTRPRRPWIVKFKHNKRSIHVGSFETLEQATLAATAYVEKRRQCLK